MQCAQISQKQDCHNIYVIMCPLGYHHNGFVATHALGHMMCGYHMVISYQLCGYHLTIHHVPKCMSCHKAIVVITKRAYILFCFHIYIIVRTGVPTSPLFKAPIS